MALFDNLRNDSGISMGSPLTGAVGAKNRDNEKRMDESIALERGKIISKRDSGLDFQAMQMENARRASIFEGFVRPTPPVKEERTKCTLEEFNRYIHESKVAFEKALTTSLFVGKVNVIIMESLNLDDSIKSLPHLEEKIYEMALESYKELDATKNFAKMAYESELPPMVEELYDVCARHARLDTETRFKELGTKYEAFQGEIEDIQAAVQNEVDNLYLKDDFYAASFENDANTLIMQNEDVIDEIKSKVSGEIEAFKNGQDTMKDIKESMSKKREEIGAELDDNGNSETSTDPEKETDDENQDGEGGDDASNDDAGGDKKDDSSSGETKDSNEGEDKKGEEPSDGEGKEKSAPDASENSDGNPDKSAEKEGGEKKEEDKPQKDDKTQEEDTNNGVTAELPSDVAMEIDDAASFAESYSHTFNTGSEKFDDLYRKYSSQFAKASELNDIKKMHNIQAAASAAATRIDKINIMNGRKYDDTANKLKDLSSNVQFEINKVLEKSKMAAHESMSILEQLIVQIGKRKVSTEGGDISVLQRSGDKVFNEAVIDYTIFEAFNTLRLTDMRNANEREDFISSLNLYRRHKR